MKIPSIGALPWLCVAGGCVKCRFVLALINPTDCSMLLISGLRMLSFISAARMILSPLACHSVMALSMSWRNSFFGRSVQFVCARYLTCCWCVDMGPDDTHGQYAAIICRV